MLNMRNLKARGSTEEKYLGSNCRWQFKYRSTMSCCWEERKRKNPSHWTM